MTIPQASPHQDHYITDIHAFLIRMANRGIEFHVDGMGNLGARGGGLIAPQDNDVVWGNSARIIAHIAEHGAPPAQVPEPRSFDAAQFLGRLSERGIFADLDPLTQRLTFRLNHPRGIAPDGETVALIRENRDELESLVLQRVAERRDRLS